MGVIVLTEDDANEAIIGVDDGKGVELVVPDNVVGDLEGRLLGAHDKLLARSHERGDLGLVVIAGGTVVAARDDTEELAVGRAVLGHGHGGVTGLLLEAHDLLHRHLRRERGVGHDDAGLVVLDGLDHGGLGLGGLGAVDEAHAALGGEGDAHALARNGLHDGGDHGDVQRDPRLLTGLVAAQGRLKGDVRRDVLGRRIARYEQVLRESVRFAFEERCHVCSPNLSIAADGGPLAVCRLNLDNCNV